MTLTSSLLLHPNETDAVLMDVYFERGQQDEQHHEQNHTLMEWVGIESEEIGEVSMATNELHWGAEPATAFEKLKALRQEWIQVAAVAVAAVESIDRNLLDVNREPNLSLL